jgi:hypothetical protein
MKEPRNRVVQVNRFGGPDGLEVADAAPPTAGRGEVRVRVLASGLEYTERVDPASPLPADDAPPSALRVGL